MYVIGMPSTEIVLKLGDIIELIAPANPIYHQKSFYISYIDDETIEILDIINGFKHKLDIATSGYFTDESITQLALLSRAPEDQEGYARQNGLVVGQWIDIHFGGELPSVITGEISNLDEDMIEILTYPDTDTIYIDFAYKGIPKWLPIEHIVLRDKPEHVKHSLRAFMANAEETGELITADASADVATLEQSPDGDMLIKIPNKPLMDKNIDEVMRELVFNIKDVVFGSEEEIQITTEVKKSEQRYGLDIQLNDLFDELLSTIPNNKRTTHVMHRVTTIVKRFKELREQFSIFDENGNVTGFTNFDAAYKPIKEHMQSLDYCLRWILPVVKQQTKLYDVPNTYENDAISQESLIKDLSDYTQLKELHKHSYNDFYVNLDSMLKPYSPSSDSAIEVKTDLEVIVQGMEDYYNFAIKQVRDQMEVVNRRFTMQKYNLGLSKMQQHTMKSGKTVYLREPMTPADAANITSWIMLPQQALEFSRIDMPGTSIAQRCNLSHNWLYYHRFLRSGTKVRNYDANMPINYEKESANTFLSTVSDFTSNKSASELLENILPRSRAIINLMREHVKHPYSFHAMISYYEPFFIRPDTIVYSAKTLDDKQKGTDIVGGGSYQEVRYRVKEMVKQYKATLAQIGSDFGDLAEARYEFEPKTLPNNLQLQNAEYADALTTLYSTDWKKQRETEALNAMLLADGGAAYAAAASALLSMLYKPDLSKLFDPAALEKHVSKSCSTRSLVKRYRSVRDMQKDNNETDVFVDKEFDTTPYDIMKKYADDQKKMEPEEFLNYLKIVLTEKHGAEPENVAELAQTLVAKRKRVQNGNYALLEIKPTGSEDAEVEANARAKKSYYVRRKNTWIREDINDETFCNLSPGCILSPDNKICETENSAAARIANKEASRAMNADHIDIMLDLSIEDLNATLKKQTLYKFNVLKKMRWIRESTKKQHSIYAHALGTQHAEINITLSPFLKLRDHICGLRDIAERSANIVRFREHFCREAIRSDTVHESDAWFYCVDTNSKLLPKFIYELAYVFMTGGDYSATLDAICRRQGKLSEDLDSIVDKHSGYVIKYVDYAEDEGFNEQGFRISTRDILAQDAAEALESGLEQQQQQQDAIVFRKDTGTGRKIFENITTQHVYNIARALCDYTGVDFTTIEDRVMSLSSEFIKNLDTPEMYAAKQEKAAKKNIKIASYETYYDQNKIYYTACVTFVCIQTAIPSFKPKKTFPGCMFSFAGYPLDPVEEATSGLKYFACIIENIKSSIAPWNSIGNQKRDTILSRMMELMTKRLALHPDVHHLINSKRNSMELQESAENTPTEHDVKKWVHFQPPIVPFVVKNSMGALSPEFKEELANALKTGKDTATMIGTVYQKIISSTYAVVDTINKEVAIAGKEALLRAGTLVFLENACCAGSGKAIDYFIEKDDIITRLIASVKINSAIFHDTKTICRAPYLFYTNIEGRIVPTPQNDFIEELVYTCFIKYCNLDNELPVPDDLLKFYPDKPALDKNMDLLQTIDALKKSGHNHNLNSFADLMQTIARRNTVHLHIEAAPPARRNISHFTDLLEHLAKTQTTEKSLVKHIQTVVDLYYDNKKDKVDALNSLKRHLLKSNRALLKVVETFIKDFDVSFKTAPTKKLLENLANYGVWKENQHNLYGFFHNTVFFKTKILPSIICNGQNMQFASMKHWELSPIHREELERFCTNYFKKLTAFEKDTLLCEYFMDADLQERFINLNMFAENIPIFDDETELFDRETMQLLYTYINYSVFYEMIICSDNDKFTREMMGDTASATPDADLVRGEKPKFKKRVCALLTTLVEMDASWKATINVTYAELHDKVFKASKQEKKTITNRFEAMSQEERNVEFMLKKYKMGMWNVGEETGIYKYDAKTYDREVTGAMAANTMDVDELRAYDDAQADEAADAEAFDISGLDEDYTDGVYYAEDAAYDE